MDTPFQPEILLLCCRRALAADLDVEGLDWSNVGCRTRCLVLPCSCKIEVSHLLKYLAQGIDAVEIVSCRDECCEFLDGNARVEKRVAHARRLLAQVPMAPERIGLDHGAELTAPQVAALVEARAAAVAPLGRNPMKKEVAP